jgi:hypothetical protein
MSPLFFKCSVKIGGFMRGFIFLIFVILSLISCKPSADEQTELKFLTTDRTSLMAKAYGKIKVCLTGSFGNKISDHKSNITRSIGKWLAPIKKIDPRVNGEVNFGYGSNCDVFIEYSRATPRSHAFIQPVPRLNLSYDLPEHVVLHEFGHAFGLLDTYIEDVWTCKKGQEDSVMCQGEKYMTLQDDDIDGVVDSFAKAFPGRVPKGYDPTPDKKIKEDKDSSFLEDLLADLKKDKETDDKQKNKENDYKQKNKENDYKQKNKENDYKQKNDNENIYKKYKRY